MDLLLISFILLSVAFLLKIIAQNKKVQVLEEQNKKLRMRGSSNELTVAAKEKLEAAGNIKTVKFVREETGMSLLEAKQYVDRLEENK